MRTRTYRRRRRLLYLLAMVAVSVALTLGAVVLVGAIEQDITTGGGIELSR